MPFCQNCGTPNADGVSSCIKCNSPLLHAAPISQPSLPQPVLTPSPAQMPLQQSFTPLPLPAALAAQTAAAPRMPQSQNAGVDANTKPPDGSRYAVLSTGSIWGSLFLMNIPIIGWIVCLCWCFSKKINENRRNLARAALIFIILQIVGLIIIFSILNLVFNTIISAAQSILDISASNIMGELGGINDALDKIMSILGFFIS